MATSVTFEVNGVEHSSQADDATPLLYILRNDLKLKGAKFGCGLGQCGACTVLIDGQSAMSCDTPLWAVDGKSVTTIEATAGNEVLPVLQRAFVAEQAMQCGYCASGIIMSAAALLARDADPDESAIKAALARNLCRCGAHTRMIKAVQRAARELRS
jgi:nicotinate dehydrogenase subunit A